MTYQFRVKLITPAFTYGATNEPEIRESSIRGLLRWWFRTLACGVLGGPKGNTSCLRKVEHYIFGSTERASSFSILVNPRRAGRNSSLKKSEIDEVILEKRYRNVQYSTLYLTYGIEKGRDGLSGEFDLTVRMNPTATDLQRRTVLSVIALWGYLGGIGRRSRRGLGSVGITRAPEYDIPLVSIPFGGKENILKMIQHIRGLISEISREVGCSEGKEWVEDAGPEAGKIVIMLGPNRGEWREALWEIGFVLRHFREKDKRGHKFTTVKTRKGRLVKVPVRRTSQYLDIIEPLMRKIRELRSVDGDSMLGDEFIDGLLRSIGGKRALNQSIFGLPHNYYSRSHGMRARIIWGSGRRPSGSRRASPLLFKVIAQGESYEPLLVYPSLDHTIPCRRFLPEGSSPLVEFLKGVRGEERLLEYPLELDAPDPRVIDDFLKWLSSRTGPGDQVSDREWKLLLAL